MRDVERLDSEAIAGKYQAARRFSPERDGEHAAQAGEALRVPFEEGVEDGFGVAVDMKSVAERFQFGAQFQVVVDFAVEDDYGVAIGRKDGLVAAFEVNNLQASGAERADFGLEDALLVGSAMDEGRRGAPDAVRIGRPIFMGETGDAAQIATLLSVSVLSIVATV